MNRLSPNASKASLQYCTLLHCGPWSWKIAASARTCNRLYAPHAWQLPPPTAYCSPQRPARYYSTERPPPPLPEPKKRRALSRGSPCTEVALVATCPQHQACGRDSAASATSGGGAAASEAARPRRLRLVFLVGVCQGAAPCDPGATAVTLLRRVDEVAQLDAAHRERPPHVRVSGEIPNSVVAFRIASVVRERAIANPTTRSIHTAHWQHSFLPLLFNRRGGRRPVASRYRAREHQH